MFNLLLVSILLSSSVYAEPCSDKPSVGFGFATLEQMRNQINKSYIIKEHCKKNKEIFSQLEGQKSQTQEMSKAIGNSKLVILGEEHNSPAQRDYGKIFDDLKKQNSKIDCLFLEWNPNDLEAQKLINGERPNSYNYFGHYELVASARASQVKIFAVDNREKTTKYDPKDSQNYIRQSNLGIYKNIKKLFDSGTCNKGVLLIGKAHIEHPQIQIDPKDSVKTFFEADGITTTAINFIYSGKNVYSDNFDQQWAWNICPDDGISSPLKARVAIAKDQLNKTEGMAIYPVISFDYYLFLPEVDSQRLYP